MGARNLRAVCPKCGGKIHTQPKGLGHFTWANSWFLVKTGTECQHCGVALSGKVKMGNQAELASESEAHRLSKIDEVHQRQDESKSSSPGADDVDVLLTHVGEKVPTIKVVVDSMDLDLRDAKILVEAAPSTIARQISHDDAELLKMQLEEVGSSAELQKVSDVESA